MRMHTIEVAGEHKTREEAVKAMELALQVATPEGHHCHVTGLIANEQTDGTWTVTMRAQSFPGHMPGTRAVPVDVEVVEHEPHEH